MQLNGCIKTNTLNGKNHKKKEKKYYKKEKEKTANVKQKKN